MTATRWMLIAALAGGLAACGGEAEAGGEPVSPEEQEALESVPTPEDADAAAAEEINADNLEDKLSEMEADG